jgi:hypothetical protein
MTCGLTCTKVLLMCSYRGLEGVMKGKQACDNMINENVLSSPMKVNKESNSTTTISFPMTWSKLHLMSLPILENIIINVLIWGSSFVTKKRRQLKPQVFYTHNHYFQH